MRVFVSYSQDSDAHAARVLALAQALRTAGIDAWIDRFEPAPAQGWPAWMREQVTAAERIVCVCTAAYKTRFEAGTTRIPAGGVPWEGPLIEGRVFDGDGGVVVPVVFPGGGRVDVPTALANLTRIAVTPPDVAPLVARLLDHDRVPPAPLGAAPIRSAGASPEAWLPPLAEVAAGHEFRSGELRYRLVERVASGGFGQVWRAVRVTRRGDGRTVAVKVMHPHLFDRKDRRDRFRRGAQAMVDLDHPGIVRVLCHQVEDRRRLWFAMEWYGRGDLARAVRAGMPAEEAVQAVLAVGDALTAAHAKGFVHRDVKPQNILIGDDGRPRLTDFDLVRDLEHSRTQITRVMGTELFMAPEQADPEVQADHRADVYGLAMTVLWAALGGTLPRGLGRNWDRTWARIRLPERLKDVLSRGAEEAPEDRFGSVAALVEAVREALEAPAAPDPPEPTRPRIREVRPQRPATTEALPSGDGEALLAAVEDRPPDEAVALLWGTVSPERPLTELGCVHWALVRLGQAPQRERFFRVCGRWPDGGPTVPETVPIPAGTFQMGSPEDVGHDRERPQHAVTLSAFRLATTPVTVAAYRQLDRAVEGADDHPVVRVDFWGAWLFAAFVGGRLPTEAAWEYACRAGTTTAYWSGDREADLARVGWYRTNGKRRTHPVGKRQANAWGLHDVHGNVWEWTADARRTYSTDPQVDPTHPRGRDRVIRGGSAWGGADWCRSAYRNWGDPSLRGGGLGFRFALPSVGPRT